jgi:RHS repeat-associated protein
MRTYSDALGRTIRTVENLQGTGAVTETTPSDQNRTTQYVFDTKGRLAWLDALNPKGSGNGVEEQLTYYAYTNPYNASRPTAVAYPDMSPAMVSVDQNTLIVTLAGSDYVSTAFDLAGRPVSRTDQRGTTHAYTYDTAGRFETDAVTAFGGDTDTYIQAIKFTYDTIGRRAAVTSYTDAACTAVANDVAWTYDGDTAGDLGWGGVKTSWQDHAGTAGSGDPSVQYAFSDGATGTAAKFVRLSSVTYPGPATPRTVYFNYSTTGVGGAVGQLSNIASDAQGTTKHVQYTYLGMQTILSVQTPGTYLSYGGFGRFPGFDRFGRVVWQKWGGDPGQDAYFYGYDRGSNRIWRAERRVRYQFQQSPDRGRDEGYAYDGLNRLVWAQRGTLTGTRTAGHPFAAYDGDFNLDGLVNTTDYNILNAWVNKGGDEWSEGDVYPDGTVNVNDYLMWLRVYQSQQPTRSVTHEWTWGLEALGNWGSYNVTTSAGTLNQTRTHDAANELINISSTGGSNWISPVHDAAGNMTRMPRPGDEGTAAEALLAVYDAWNRPVRFYKDSNANGSLDVGTDALVLTSRYDGMSHRIQKIVAGGTTVTYDYYYNEAGQVLEERKTVGGGATQTYAQYIWDGRYIHSPSCRFRDSDDNGSLDETLYYCNDANFNVTALVNTAGAVVERYQYTPYGSVTVCDSAWAPRAGNVSAYANDILFTGHRIDWETGLYGTLHRVYHPTIGRWVQWDPIGYTAALNLMAYVGSRPITRTDPRGLEEETSWYDDTTRIGPNPPPPPPPSLDTINCYAGCAATYYYCVGCKNVGTGKFYPGKIFTSWEHEGGSACMECLRTCLANCNHRVIQVFPCCMANCEEGRKKAIVPGDEIKKEIAESIGYFILDVGAEIGTSGEGSVGAGVGSGGLMSVIEGLGMAPSIADIYVKSIVPNYYKEHFTIDMTKLYSDPQFIWHLIMELQDKGMLRFAPAAIQSRRVPQTAG